MGVKNGAKRVLEVLVGYVTKKGLKVAQFRNDQGQMYTTRVSLFAGSNEEDCTCEGFSEWGQVCYHMQTLEGMSLSDLLARNVVNPVVSTIGDIGERGSLTHTAEETVSALAFVNAYRNKSA
jgi:hypothetical protein